MEGGVKRWVASWRRDGDGSAHRCLRRPLATAAASRQYHRCPSLIFVCSGVVVSPPFVHDPWSSAMCVVEAAVPQSLRDVVRVPSARPVVGVVAGASRRKIVSNPLDSISCRGSQPDNLRRGGVVMLRLHTSPFLP